MKFYYLAIFSLLQQGCEGGDSKGSYFTVGGIGEVNYKITVNALWSKTTHPDNFPVSPHFSGFVGATHSINALYWEEGGIATAGIEQMAETGGTSQLVTEINSNIALNDSEFIALVSVMTVHPVLVHLTYPSMTLILISPLFQCSHRA